MEISAELQEILKRSREKLQDGSIREIYGEIAQLQNAAGLRCAGELTELLVSSGVNIWEYFSWYIPYGAFYKSRIKTISIPSTIRLISVGAFERCVNLENITIPNSVSRINAYAFANCESLEEILIPDSVVRLDDGVFCDCFKLKYIRIGDSVEEIGSLAFAGCENLTHVTVGKSVKTIYDQAFYNCTKLTNITIPTSVTRIGSSVFAWCDSLHEVTYEGTREQWEKIKKTDHWNSNSALKTVKCVDGDINL